MARNFGSGDGVALTNVAALRPAFPMLVAGIVYNPSSSSNRVVFSFWGTGGYKLAVNTSQQLRFTKYGMVDIDSGTNTLSASTWYLVGAYVTSTNVRFFNYNYSNDTFSANNVANSSAFSATNPNTLRIGCENNASSNTNAWLSDIELVGAWISCSASLTDDQLHNLAFSKEAWFELGNPTGLWHLDQQSTGQAVVDEIQTSNQAALSGTTVSTVSLPVFTPGSELSITHDRPAGSPGSLNIPFIASGETLYTPTLTASGAATLNAPFISAGTTLYAPALGHANQDINMPFISAATSLYTPRLTQQPKGISIGFGDDTLTVEPGWVRVD